MHVPFVIFNLFGIGQALYGLSIFNRQNGGMSPHWIIPELILLKM